MGTPTITTQILREAATGANPTAEADLLAGARHIARSVAQGFSRVDADDLAGELVTELITTRPIGLPGAAWTIARTLAGAMNAVEQIAGAASLGTIRRGGGLATVADGLGVQPGDDGQVRLPHSASVDVLQEEYGYDPEAAPHEPVSELALVADALLDEVQRELGWDARTLSSAVQAMFEGLEASKTANGTALVATRYRNRLTRQEHKRELGLKAGVPDREWARFLKILYGTPVDVKRPERRCEPGLVAIIGTRLTAPDPIPAELGKVA